jgi:hypothetical protein
MANPVTIVEPDVENVDPTTAPYTNKGYFGNTNGIAPSDNDPNSIPYTNPQYVASNNPGVVTSANPDYVANINNTLQGNTVVPDDIQPDPGIDGRSGHDPEKGAFLGAVGGAVVGALAGGPVGAVIGGIAGAAAAGTAVAGIDMVDNDDSPGELSDRRASETPGEYTDRLIESQEPENSGNPDKFDDV